MPKVLLMLYIAICYIIKIFCIANISPKYEEFQIFLVASNLRKKVQALAHEASATKAGCRYRFEFVTTNNNVNKKKLKLERKVEMSAFRFCVSINCLKLVTPAYWFQLYDNKGNEDKQAYSVKQILKVQQYKREAHDLHTGLVRSFGPIRIGGNTWVGPAPLSYLQSKHRLFAAERLCSIKRSLANLNPSCCRDKSFGHLIG